MIIRSSKSLKKYDSIKIEEKPAIVKEEVKPLDNEVIHKSKKRKITPTPVIEETIVVEEKVEDEDLSKWLEEHTED